MNTWLYRRYVHPLKEIQKRANENLEKPYKDAVVRIYYCVYYLWWISSTTFMEWFVRFLYTFVIAAYENWARWNDANPVQSTCQRNPNAYNSYFYILAYVYQLDRETQSQVASDGNLLLSVSSSHQVWKDNHQICRARLEVLYTEISTIALSFSLWWIRICFSLCGPQFETEHESFRRICVLCKKSTHPPPPPRFFRVF